ncbi:NlpC/P60 family protein [Hymenobacter sp. NBH84]|uniref:C40 family peptidase n=1 Tax=Hymenobacter sp. NBH84 TaxID=2596915 RepID=UPI00162651D1|nr:C40 family peptidase [Hymenobacter sp. NBH84]QNE39246.1 NlpC/P60 family protein [Hymenobacter sp. NBH84]
MRYVWITFLSLVAVLLAVFLWPRPAAPSARVVPTQAVPVVAVVHRTPRAPTPVMNDRAEAIIRFAEQQLGTRYCYAGTTPAGGFDCSGFVYYVFKQFDISVPHSTAQLISVGRPVERSQARPGDIVVFTGTAATSTTPGHAGIVLSEPGEPLRFIHSSSARHESGVKISQVEGSGYERRFMQVRRVL